MFSRPAYLLDLACQTEGKQSKPRISTVEERSSAEVEDATCASTALT
jgi:hypothetical protein